MAEIQNGHQQTLSYYHFSLKIWDLSQILLEFITNNVGICQIEHCASITAGGKASE